MLLVDLPDLVPAVVARLLPAAAPTLARAAYDGEPGHPVVLGRDHWRGVAASATGDHGAKAYLRAHAAGSAWSSAATSPPGTTRTPRSGDDPAPTARACPGSAGCPTRGTAWVDGLPALLADLESAWDVRIERRSLPGGSSSLVAAATTASGEPRAVKIAIAGEDLAQEARVLAAAEGRGYALLHAYDRERQAILMERLGTSLEQSPRPVEDAVDLLVATLRRGWRTPLDVAPAPPPGRDRASARLEALLRPDTGAAPSEATPAILARAAEYARRRAAAYDPDACVVAHGDPHPANLLRVRAPHPAPGRVGAGRPRGVPRRTRPPTSGSPCATGPRACTDAGARRAPARLVRPGGSGGRARRAGGVGVGLPRAGRHRPLPRLVRRARPRAGRSCAPRRRCCGDRPGAPGGGRPVRGGRYCPEA